MSMQHTWCTSEYNLGFYAGLSLNILTMIITSDKWLGWIWWKFLFSKQRVEQLSQINFLITLLKQTQIHLRLFMNSG